jgi:hypothetical protein
MSEPACASSWVNPAMISTVLGAPACRRRGSGVPKYWSNTDFSPPPLHYSSISSPRRSAGLHTSAHSTRAGRRKSAQFGMHRHWTISGIVLLAAVFGIYMAASRPKEPLHAGKTVTQWLDAGYEDCSMALYEIGPPALPFILTTFGRAETPRMFGPFAGACKRFPGLRSFFPHLPEHNLDEDRVCSLLLELGPRTIPMLAHELENRHANVRAISARTLSIWRERGKDIRVALPALGHACNDPSAPVRMWAAHALRSTASLAVTAGTSEVSRSHE